MCVSWYSCPQIRFCHSPLQADIRGVLKGYTPHDHYYEFTKFVPYLLDDAVIGTVSCAPAMTGFDDTGLLPFIAAAASNTTVLAEGFADFLPTAAIEFHYDNILTWKQVKTCRLCSYRWDFPVKLFLHAALYWRTSNITMLTVQNVYTLGHSAGSEAVEHHDLLPTGRRP